MIQSKKAITIAKVEEICKLIPGLNNEINWDRGVSTKSKDNVKYVFKNGSSIDILAARQSSRGQITLALNIFSRQINEGYIIIMQLTVKGS